MPKSEQRLPKTRQTGFATTQMLLGIRQLVVAWVKASRAIEQRARKRYVETGAFCDWWALMKARWQRWRLERRYKLSDEEEGNPKTGE